MEQRCTDMLYRLVVVNCFYDAIGKIYHFYYHDLYHDYDYNTAYRLFADGRTTTASLYGVTP